MGQEIGLEVSRKAVFGCLGVLALGVVAAFFGCRVAMGHGEQSARSAVERAYSLAKAQDYEEMVALVSKSGILTLQKAWKLNGPISDYKVLSANAQVFGRPSGVDVAVTRSGKSYVDVIALQDSVHLNVIVEFPKEDLATHRADRAVRVIAP